MDEEAGPSFSSCRIDDFEFADGSYTVFLGLKQLAELEEKCGAGIGAIFKRLGKYDHYTKDLYEIIRLGLIGGQILTGVGPSPTEAKKLVERYVETQPKDIAHAIASKIISACVMGFEAPDEDLKKKTATKTPADGST